MASLDEHYSANDIEERIIKALRDAGLNTDQKLTPAQLAALDHFHTGGYASSLELLKQSRILPEHRVLDIGAGLAGAARMMVAEVGCRVDCIELSADYCVGAQLLNKLTGMQDQIGIYEGSALDLPFEDRVFDAVWMQNVGMNIVDKQQFYSEIYRVLKPGGCFAFQEMTAGNTKTTYFPLPWATVPGDNCLIATKDVQSLLADIGFSEDVFENASESQLNPVSNQAVNENVPPPLSLSAYVDDLALKAENAQHALREGQVQFIRAVFRKE